VWDAGLALSPDGLYLAAAGEGYLIEIWDLGTQEPVQVLAGHTDYVLDLAFSPEGMLLASAQGQDFNSEEAPGPALLWDLATGEQLAAFAHPDPEVSTSQVAFSSDGAYLLTGHSNGDVLVWDLENLDIFARYRSEDGAAVGDIALSPAGDRVAVGAGSLVTVWEFPPPGE